MNVYVRAHPRFHHQAPRTDSFHPPWWSGQATRAKGAELRLERWEVGKKLRWRGAKSWDRLAARGCPVSVACSEDQEHQRHTAVGENEDRIPGALSAGWGRWVFLVALQVKWTTSLFPVPVNPYRQCLCFIEVESDFVHTLVSGCLFSVLFFRFIHVGTSNNNSSFFLVLFCF